MLFNKENGYCSKINKECLRNCVDNSMVNMQNDWIGYDSNLFDFIKVGIGLVLVSSNLPHCYIKKLCKIKSYWHSDFINQKNNKE